MFQNRAIRPITIPLKSTLNPQMPTPADALSIILVSGTFHALYQVMERDPQTYYELLIWSKALQMKGIVFPFIDSLPALELS